MDRFAPIVSDSNFKNSYFSHASVNAGVIQTELFMHESNPDWRSLKVGDCIQIVRIPSLFNEPHYHNGDWEDTFSLYRELMANQAVLTISEIDIDGRPWVEYETVDGDGCTVSNSLAVDDDSWQFSNGDIAGPKPRAPNE